jgi:DNA-binding NarL/FixJ family response regulator
VSLRILLADDDGPTRVLTRAVLEEAGMVVVAELDNGDDAVLAAIGTRPDVALLDVRMPGDGIEAAARIAVEVPEVIVVMLAGATTDEELFAALRAGAKGFLLKDTDPDRLPHALEGVVSGEAAVPRTLVARLIEEFRRREQTRPPVVGPQGERLTQREWSVLMLMGEGLPTPDIADRLGLAEVTVRRYVSTVLSKLHVADRDGAVEALRAALDE